MSAPCRSKQGPAQAQIIKTAILKRNSPVGGEKWKGLGTKTPLTCLLLVSRSGKEVKQIIVAQAVHVPSCSSNVIKSIKNDNQQGWKYSSGGRQNFANA